MFAYDLIQEVGNFLDHALNGATEVAMSSAERNYYGGSFLSDDFREAIARRLRELCGLGLIVVTGVAAAALATWSVSDPSFSHATSAPVRNLLGAPGAITADLAMQLFGLATVAIILPFASWGWRLTTHRVLDRLRWRLVAWLASPLFAAGFASCLPRTAHWPLPTGIGGVIGDALLRVIASVAGGPLYGIGHTVTELIFGILGFAAILIASGVGFHRRDVADGAVEEEGNDPGEDKQNGRDYGSVSLGWLVHGFLSIKSRVVRLAGRLLGSAGHKGRAASQPYIAALRAQRAAGRDGGRRRR